MSSWPKLPDWGKGSGRYFFSCRRSGASRAPTQAAGAERPGGWSGLIYFRLHGSPQIYRSPYEEERLQAIAERLTGTQASGAEAWCIFDNTTSYAALGNAVDLKANAAV
jgi:uncharacterized protein YecE (DUF72 family)